MANKADTTPTNITENKADTPLKKPKEQKTPAIAKKYVCNVS